MSMKRLPGLLLGIVAILIVFSFPASTVSSSTFSRVLSAPPLVSADPPVELGNLVLTDSGWEEWKKLPPEVRAKVDPRILAELRGEALPTHMGSLDQAEIIPTREPLDKTRFLVYLKAEADLKAVVKKRFATQLEQRVAVFNALVRTAQATQGPVKAHLDVRMSQGDVDSYQPFYIFNGFAVEGGLSTIIELAKRDDVKRIVANYALLPLWSSGGTVTSPTDDQGDLDSSNWNIDLVDAERVWDEFGITGSGAVVGGIDTGVDYMHPALAGTYRGNLGGGVFDHNYNWFDPDDNLYPGGDLGSSRSTAPFDFGEHGTHTMGTMVGDGGTLGTQVGMAPGARWIAVSLNQLYVMSTVADDIVANKAFQWMMCPTDLSGALSTADCSRAPDVVNNSWGSANPADDTFRPAIQALRAAGVSPVFAAGNPFAGPGSIGAPGNVPEAITVGATDSSDDVAYFSGRGPSFYEGEQKPELSAPGVSIKSTMPGGGYDFYSGTSMAAPHVAGLIALMVSADLQDGYRDLNVDELETFIERTAVDLGGPGPDDDYGYGRIDAYNAVRWVRSAGDLRGTVRDAVTSVPIAGATVAGIKVNSGDTFTTAAGATGQYSIIVPAGRYDITVEAWGYNNDTFAGQMVITSVLSIADFFLTPLPTAVLTGRVISGATSISGALVYVENAPSVHFTTGVGGAYTLTLPVGTHGMTVEANGYRILHQEVSVASGGSTDDFSMTPAPTILLVDADTYGGWFSGWPVRNFFEWPLDQEGYLYDLWVVQYTTFNDTQVMADGSLGYGIPSISTLLSYDLVIWCHGVGGDWPFGSTVNMGADDELMGYLGNGGRLIISGQDLGYADDGTTFYDGYLHADYTTDVASGEGESVSGVDFLAGLNLEITNASLHGYANGATSLSPDAVVPGDGVAFPVMTYDNGNGIAALAIDPCDASYRAVYFALGYENIAPRAYTHDPAIAEVLERSIDWVMVSTPRPDYGTSVTALPARQVGAPGNTVSYNLRIFNKGTMTATFGVNLAGNIWNTHVLSGAVELMTTVEIPPCGSQELSIRVDIPATASPGDQDTVTITAFRSPTGTPSASADVTTVAFPRWQFEASAPYAASRVSLAGWEDSIYLMGGLGGTTENYEFDACTLQWIARAPIPVSVGNHAAAAVDGKIYVAGGSISGITTRDNLQIYDIAGDTWSAGAPMSKARWAHTAVALNGEIYVVGGLNDDGVDQATTFVYNPTQNNWRTVAPMSVPRCWIAGAALNGKLYVVGGSGEVNTVEEYDPVADTWTTKSPMLNGRAAAGAAGVGDYLYVVGGGYSTYLSTAERYNPATDTWEVIGDLNVGRRTLGVAHAAGKIFAAGGWSGSYVNSLESLLLLDDFCNSNKTAWQRTVGPGKRITYTVEVHADFAEPRDLSVVDPIPAGTTFASFGVNVIGATYNSTSGQVEWSGAIPAGSAPLTFTFGVDVDLLGWGGGELITNTVIFAGGSAPIFDRATVTTLGIPDPSPSTKKVDKDQALAGDVLTYTLYIENGSSVRDVITLCDPIPPRATYVPGSLTYTLGSGSYDAVDDVINWTGTLPDSDIYVGTGNDYGWGDSDGNGTVPGVAFDWIDIRATGSNAGSGDDLYYCGMPIGFAFSFYGTNETTFCASTNGFVSFDADGYSDLGNDCPLPSPNGNAALIAGIWDDLVVVGGIYYQTFGTVPNRYTVVQWVDVHHYGGGAYFDFEVILYEKGAIKVQMLDAGPEKGNRSTTGIEDYTETRGVSYACDSPESIHNSLAIIFLPPGGTWDVSIAEITFAVTVTNPLPVNTWITNTATIAGSLNAVERSASTLINSMDLSTSSKAADKTQAVVGEVVTYEFVLQNTGLVTATGVTLNDPLPANTAYVPGTVSCGRGDCSYDPMGQVITWSGDVTPGDSVTLTFALTLTTSLADMMPVTNTATLDNCHGDLYDLEAVFLARIHDLSVSFKLAEPSWVGPGDTVTFTVYIHNSGVASAAAEMRDELPSDLTYVPESLVCGTGSCGYASGVITWTGTVHPRSMVPVRFLATVSADISYTGRITNTAVITDLVWNVGYPEAATVDVTSQIYLPVVINNYSGYEWGDSDGNGTVSGATFNWIDISDMGTAVLLGDDDYVGPISIGFSFGFYGNAYAKLYASSNGFLSFDPDAWQYGNDPITSTDLPNNIIALMWDDLDPGVKSDPLYYAYFATCPIGGGACFVVQYDGYHHHPGDGANVAGTFEAVLFDSGSILLQFLDAGDEKGAGSTTGIENSDGTEGVQYAYETAILHDGLAILFRPVGGMWY